MSEAKFTKRMEVGVTTDRAPFCVDGFCNDDGQRFEVCNVWSSYDDTEPCEQSEANAHLIAAAPEMYAMLERFLPYSTFDNDGNEALHGGDFNWNEDDDPMISELKQLLAKARGE